MTLLWRPE